MAESIRFYIVFSPGGPTPPVVMHASHREAFAIAHHMAKQFPGQTFHVMKSASKPIRAEAEPPVEASADA